MTPLLDDDMYPTEFALEEIQNWSDNFNDLMLFVRPLWYYSMAGYWTETETDFKRTEYAISTAGWSGNESIIQALKTNKHHFWTLCWVQSRRGGHYIFEVKTNGN